MRNISNVFIKWVNGLDKETTLLYLLYELKRLYTYDTHKPLFESPNYESIGLFAQHLENIIKEEPVEKFQWHLNHMYKCNERVENCLQCKHHFFSDCYLECAIHNRINNNEKCKDFKKVENGEEREIL